MEADANDTDRPPSPDQLMDKFRALAAVSKARPGKRTVSKERVP